MISSSITQRKLSSNLFNIMIHVYDLIFDLVYKHLN